MTTDVLIDIRVVAVHLLVSPVAASRIGPTNKGPPSRVLHYNFEAILNLLTLNLTFEAASVGSTVLAVMISGSKYYMSRFRVTSAIAQTSAVVSTKSLLVPKPSIREDPSREHVPH